MEHGLNLLLLAVTRPEVRGAGYYRALAARRVADRPDLPDAAVVSDLSRPVLVERLGFLALTRLTLWTRPRRAAAAPVRRAIAAEEVLDAPVRLPSGEQPGRAFLLELFTDHLVHTWDLACAVGVDERLAPELVAACAEWFDAHEAQWREAGEIGPSAPVPDDADAQTALLARFGRDARTVAQR